MLRIFVIAIALAVVLPACNKSGKVKAQDQGDAAAQGQAEVDLRPIEKLANLSTELQAGVDLVMQPINDVDTLINEITSLPQRLNIDAKSLLSMASATMESGQVSIDANIAGTLEAAVVGEINNVLARVVAIVEGLKATPERVKMLTVQATTAIGQVPVLATEVTTVANVVVANPFAAADKKAQAQADIQAVTQVQADVQAKISEIQNTIAGIPALATGALAKLAASFAGSAG